MELTITYILIIYFAIGAIAIWLINRGKDVVSVRQGWIKYTVYLLIVLAVLSSMLWKPVYFALVCAILLVSLIEMFGVWKRNPGRRLLTLLVSLLLFGSAVFSFLNFILLSSLAFNVILYTIVFSFDGFSQIAGQLFGKNKLMPKISPGKTVGGLVGGMVSAILTGLLLFPFVMATAQQCDYTFQILLSLVVALAAFLGDLIASVYKRLNKTKDYSSLVPGHGGMLDRFDSFIGAGACLGMISLLLNWIQ